MNVPAGMKINLQILKIKSQEYNFLKKNELFIKKLARVIKIDSVNQMQRGSISISVSGGDFCFPLQDVIDISKEKARLGKTLEKLQYEYLMLKKKLQNDKFLTHAPTDVVNEIKDRYAKLFDEIEKKELALSRLS